VLCALSERSSPQSMSTFHTGIHQRYVMYIDPAAASLRAQYEQHKTIAEYMTLDSTATSSGVLHTKAMELP
jgi:hypothetical protein